MGLKRLPDVATLSRMLQEADARSVRNLRGFLRQMLFERLDTLRDTLLRRAGRITRPQGRLTLTIGACSWIKNRLLQCLLALDNAA